MNEGIFDFFKSVDKKAIDNLELKINQLYKEHKKGKKDLSVDISKLVDEMAEEKHLTGKLKNNFKKTYIETLTNGTGLIGDSEIYKSLKQSEKEGLEFNPSFMKSRGKVVEKKK